MCIGAILPVRANQIVQARVVHATPASILSVSQSRKMQQRRKAVRSRKNKRNLKPKKPKRPKTAYNFFQLSEKSKAQGISIVHNEGFAKTIGQRWKDLEPEKRMKYQYLADQDKARYERENREYLQYLAGSLKKKEAKKKEDVVKSFLTSPVVKLESSQLCEQKPMRAKTEPSLFPESRFPDIQMEVFDIAAPPVEVPEPASFSFVEDTPPASPPPPASTKKELSELDMWLGLDPCLAPVNETSSIFDPLW
mmetsp:Transcript_7271/g.11062  ORF Transcript_7271/g.11062 Transcript_7271/m.11062 type:complete len:251 (+) Transcript_7271:35-787(+)|eukprot:CAMPEP_0167744282 /NCGR_PEP_ID=MMETSP0110_2-20121227/2501_1 /TAXON_ID=629695 /ORGANISM="Gymnochlora sp., Strain CCMP2014" /LENGTH=250 /DNA_ID=CAMNT_0007628779 /DNA_START=118 /DNA_END=870 /DNA_ORIENTATION=+